MYCIISATALYSRQRPLAALLIHFSPPLSFVGMPNSVQSAVFKIPAHLDPFGGAVCLSAVYCCCPFRRPWAGATLLWHMRCAHAALVIVETQSVPDVNRAWLSLEERGEEKPLWCRDAHRLGLLTGACVWVKCLDSDHERSVSSRRSTPPKSLFLTVWRWAEDGQGCCSVLALTVTESRCVYTAQESTVPAAW